MHSASAHPNVYTTEHSSYLFPPSSIIDCLFGSPVPLNSIGHVVHVCGLPHCGFCYVPSQVICPSEWGWTLSMLVWFPPSVHCRISFRVSTLSVSLSEPKSHLYGFPPTVVSNQWVPAVVIIAEHVVALYLLLGIDTHDQHTDHYRHFK